jgi:amidase
MDRRRFLAAGAGLGAALALPLPASSKLFAASLPADLTSLSAIDLSLAIKARQVGCAEVMQAYLAHIHRYNPTYNAIVSLVDDQELMRQATAADRALDKGEYYGWMHGMPHAVKDLSPVAGLPYTSGSPMFADRIADEDSPMVARIRSGGAIFIGKTNTPEFGLGSQSYNPVFGATGSAWNPALTAGGSSGGAASALGTHMVPVADGSDMMGSLRNPGAFNNVIGFRPSTNVMNDDRGPERALWTSGPMGRNTRDTIQLLQSIAAKPPAGDFAPLNLAGIKIGWLGNLDNYLPMEPGITELCQNSLAKVDGAGAHVEACTPQFSLSDLWRCWITLRQASHEDMWPYYTNPATRAQLKPELVWEIEQSRLLTAANKKAAQSIRNAWIRELDRLFGLYDFLALPTAQVFPFPTDIHWPKQIAGRKMDTYHRWMEVVIPGSLGGIPVINLPVGFDAKNRPMGMQIMGQFGDDKKVLEFGLAYENLTDHLQRRPNM